MPPVLADSDVRSATGRCHNGLPGWHGIPKVQIDAERTPPIAAEQSIECWMVRNDRNSSPERRPHDLLKDSVGLLGV